MQDVVDEYLRFIQIEKGLSEILLRLTVEI